MLTPHFIRQATHQDAGRISEIEIFNYRLNFYPIFQNDAFYFKELQVQTMTARYFQDKSLLPNTYVYEDSVIKGFIRIDGTEVKTLFVEPVFQGQAIGEKLLNYAVQNHAVSCLWALEKNERAIRFYEKNGFHITGARKPEEGTAEYLVKMER